MVRREPTRNTYEEFPDELKETLKESEKERGQKPTARESRDALLRDHEWHLKFLAEGALPPRNLVLPSPYPPSRISVLQAKWTHIDRIRIGIRNAPDFLLVRSVTESYVYSSSVTIVEDQRGDTARIMVCNLEDSTSDPIIPRGTMFAIKQPCWIKVSGGGYYIRVDHPSDLVLLDPDHEAVPPTWKMSREIFEGKDAAAWKRDGDMMFLKKKFRTAIALYDSALAQLISCPDRTAQVDLYRKRCGVNLVLLCFDNAANDLSQAISLYAQCNPSLFCSELADPVVIKAWLHNHSAEDSLQIASNLPRSLKDLAARIKFDLGLYQTSPEYDLQSMSSYVGPLTLHVDAATYVSGIKVKQTSHHGRGLFAARAFRTGELIMAEKAFALPSYFFGDRGSDCSLYSLGDGTATDRAGALLFKELVQKLRQNPSLRRGFFDLDDGGYWKAHGWDIEEGEDIPVDVFRIEHIRRRNCFSAPVRSMDLLTTPSPVRNGFWTHSSFVNHACLPNSVRTFIGDVLLLRATRDISEGEEITSQYVAPELTFEKRQDKFVGTWGFACDCTLCAVDKGVGKKLEGQRMAVFEELKGVAQKVGSKPTVTSLKKFAKRLRDLETCYDDEIYASLPRLCLVHPMIFLTEAWRSLKATDKMIESAAKLLKYFGILIEVKGDGFDVPKNVGLINVEAVRALKYMAEGYEAKGREQLAVKIREVAKIWFRIITGADVGVEEFLKI